MAIFLEANTKNIVESSSDTEYVMTLNSMIKEFDNIVGDLSNIEIPKEALKYHDVIKQALAAYLEMLKLLVKSSNADTDGEKKDYLNKAAIKIQEANELADSANKNIKIIESIL